MLDTTIVKLMFVNQDSVSCALRTQDKTKSAPKLSLHFAKESLVLSIVNLIHITSSNHGSLVRWMASAHSASTRA